MALPRRRDQRQGTAVRGRPLPDAERTCPLRPARARHHRRTDRCAHAAAPFDGRGARPVARHEPHRQAGPALQSRGGAAPRSSCRRHGKARTRTAISPWCRAAAAPWCCRWPPRAVRVGQSFLPMHWGRRYLNSAGANELTLAALDPHSKQPELKHAAIQVEKVALPWQVLALRMARGADAEGRALTWLDALQPLLARFRYASLGLAGREEPLLVLRAAHDEPIPKAGWIRSTPWSICRTGNACPMRDTRRSISKRALIEDDRLTELRLTGETGPGLAPGRDDRADQRR
ncbi:MAG: hypothetical protein MZW92_79920 [Comamonadaceae bacterium]|nr:hypothetical protein [Comamonadaceae bacterium]